MGHKGKYKSPSTILHRDAKTIQKNSHRNGPPRNSRAEKIKQVRAFFGLPADAKFFFLENRDHWDTPAKPLSWGCVVCFDKDTCELLLVARFNVPNEDNRDLIAEFNYAMSTLYTHSKARGPIKNNGASLKVAEELRKHPRMHPVGFRPGYDKEVKAGK